MIRPTSTLARTSSLMASNASVARKCYSSHDPRASRRQHLHFWRQTLPLRGVVFWPSFQSVGSTSILSRARWNATFSPARILYVDVLLSSVHKHVLERLLAAKLPCELTGITSICECQFYRWSNPPDVHHHCWHQSASVSALEVLFQP